MNHEERSFEQRLAAHNIDYAFDLVNAAIADPAVFDRIPRGASILPLPREDREIENANRQLGGKLREQGEEVVFVETTVATISVTPDGGLFIGQVYFTPDEAKEVASLIRRLDSPMPGHLGIDSIDGAVIALRPMLDGPEARPIHPILLADHPEIPRSMSDSRSHTPSRTREKLREILAPALR